MSRHVPFSARVSAALLLAVTAASCATSRTAADTPSGPRVTTDAGVVEGRVDSATGILGFSGIPYAAPPVGEGRWRPPQAVTPWQGVRMADRLARNCMQVRVYDDIDAFAAGVSEDCLYLNVWTAGTGGAARPVMVWIHGGGFFAGFGGEERHHGARLAQKGAVVVTLNYRLGPLGFLAHPALARESQRGVSGNYALLDQVAALEWVQRNIRRFGGDPSRVTIFGESAGGFSVGTLIATPLAKGLFQGAIMESGTGMGFSQRRDSAEAAGVRYAEVLGVNGVDAAAAARLRAVPAETLLALLAPRPPASPGGPPSRPRASLRLGPVVDGWFLPTRPDSAVALGAANLVPAIVGSNADESSEVFGAPARALARMLTARGVPAYVYLFTRAGEDSASRARGAYHSAEITFVFGRPRPILASAGRTPYDSTLAEAMSDYWVAFAGARDPNGPPAAGRLPVWPRYDATTDAAIELGATIAPRQGLRRAVYDSLDALARQRGELRP